MQNTTQEQNFYTKPATATMPSSSSFGTGMGSTTPKKVGKMPTKRLLSIAGLFLFLIVAVIGVLVAQKQFFQRGKTVAPTAPDSQPSATTYEPNSCVTTFIVPAPLALCNSKKAFTGFTSSRGSQEILPGSEFDVGDEFVFQLAISQPEQGTISNVRVIDTLPNSLEFVAGAPNAPYTVTANGQTVTATIPQISSESTVNVEFRVRVRSGNYGRNTNTAYVENLAQERVDQVCSYDFEVVEGIVECVEKNLYDLRGRLIANGGALVRGQEYEYRITAGATNQSNGEVKIHDVIPEGLTYVRPAVGSERYITNDPRSGILIANVGILEDDEATIGFIVRVPATAPVGNFTNRALVYAFPPNSRQPEPPSNADECSVTHTILPSGTAECVEKEAFTDFGGTEIAPNTAITPGDEFVYRLTITAEETTTGAVTVVDELHRDLTFIQDPGNTQGLRYNSTNRQVTLDLGTMQSGQTERVQFKVQLAADPQDTTFRNLATISTNNSTRHTCEITLKVEQPVYECNSACETNEDCMTIGDDHICYNTSSGNFCRLASNPTDTSCKPAKPTPTPTATPTPPPTGPGTPTPSPTPIIGCNDICVSNSDCANSNHICMTTADGSNRCRLPDYPNSTTCTATIASTTPPDVIVQQPVYETSTPQQPVLPTELPQTGATDWVNWLKAGLVTLGIGTALFLLL